MKFGGRRRHPLTRPRVVVDPFPSRETGGCIAKNSIFLDGFPSCEKIGL